MTGLATGRLLISYGPRVQESHELIRQASQGRRVSLNFDKVVSRAPCHSRSTTPRWHAEHRGWASSREPRTVAPWEVDRRPLLYQIYGEGADFAHARVLR